jgi:Protein of unknown function (DUF2637)
MNVATRAQRRLEEMAGLRLGWRLHLTEALAWAVTGLALAMSYHAEEDLGQSLASFHGWPAYAWPLVADGGDVLLIVLYLEYKRRQLSTWKVGLGLIAATVVMVAANIRSAWPEPTAVLMQAWVPAFALYLWHTMAAGRKPRGAPVDLRDVWTRIRREALGGGQSDPALDVPAQASALRPAAPHRVEEGTSRPEREEWGSAPNRRPRTPARAVVRELLRRHGRALTAERVVSGRGCRNSTRTDCSARSAARTWWTARRRRWRRRGGRASGTDRERAGPWRRSENW